MQLGSQDPHFGTYSDLGTPLPRETWTRIRLRYVHDFAARGFPVPSQGQRWRSLGRVRSRMLKRTNHVEVADMLLRNRGVGSIVMLIIFDFFLCLLAPISASPQIGQTLTYALGAARLLR